MAYRPFPLESFRDFPAKGDSMGPVLVDASEDILNATEEPSREGNVRILFLGVCGAGVASFNEEDNAEDSVGEPNCMYERFYRTIRRSRSDAWGGIAKIF